MKGRPLMNRMNKEKKKIEKFDAVFKDKLVTALMLAPTLSVMILSVVYQSLSSSQIALAKEPGIVLGWLSLVTVLGALVLAVMYNKVFATMALSLLYGLSAISYGIVIINGTTDVLNDGFFDMLLSVLVLPVISFISVTGRGSGAGNVLPLIIAVFITALSVAATVYIVKKHKKKEKELAKEAEARKARNSRRKVR